jgi:transcriptional regulator with XRE-family HTH domain
MATDQDEPTSMMNWDPEWGARLKQARLQARKSQEELANAIGVSQPTISNWERGYPPGPDESELKNIEKSLGRPISEAASASEPENTTDLALWLRKAIETKQRASTDNKSLGVLATEAGVSVPTIYNIINGTVASPQSRTLKKLQDYFGEAPPEVKEETSAARDVGQLGEFSQFDPHDDAQWPAEPGVYILYDISERPIYIGKSKISVASRLRDHETRFWFKRPLVQSAAYVAVKDPRLVLDVEALLIKVLRSLAIVNQKGVVRDPSNEE